MMIKFFSRPKNSLKIIDDSWDWRVRRGKGGATRLGGPGASMRYLLNKEDEHAKVLKGDPQLSVKLAESLKFKNQYTVGCLSFEEKDIELERKIDIIERFEKMCFSGLDEEQYDITWVQHTDKGRLELNFFIPNVELSTGKRLQPYYHQSDMSMFESFKNVINHEHNLTDPNDPTKRQISALNKKLPQDKKELVEAIDQYIFDMIAHGLVNDRKDVVNAIKDLGIEVTRESKQSISIKTDEFKRPIRLKGVIYGEHFRSEQITEEQIRATEEEYRRTSAERYSRACEGLQRGMETRASIFTKKYSEPTREPSQSRENTLSVKHQEYSRDVGRIGFGSYFDVDRGVLRNEYQGREKSIGDRDPEQNIETRDYGLGEFERGTDRESIRTAGRDEVPQPNTGRGEFIYRSTREGNSDFSVQQELGSSEEKQNNKQEEKEIDYDINRTDVERSLERAIEQSRREHSKIEQESIRAGERKQRFDNFSKQLKEAVRGYTEQIFKFIDGVTKVKNEISEDIQERERLAYELKRQKEMEQKERVKSFFDLIIEGYKDREMEREEQTSKKTHEVEKIIPDYEEFDLEQEQEQEQKEQKVDRGLSR